MKSLVMVVALVLVSSSAFGGMVGYWRFEEGSGVTTADDSGTGNTGHLVKDTALTPPLWQDDTPPIYGGNHSLYFPAGASVTAYDNPTLDITGSLSIHVYVKPESLVGNRPFVGKWSSDDSFLFRFDGTLAFSLAATGSGSSTDTLFYTPAPGELPLNEWTHLAAIYNHGTREMSMYINGVKKASQISWVHEIRSTNANVQIGQYENSHYAGWIDEVKIFDGIYIPDPPDSGDLPGGPVPEPAALSLVGIGLTIICKRRRL
ncbi:hypothetical protein CL614_04815 [archaeon]|nr:hypothetical protein [archaeon]